MTGRLPLLPASVRRRSEAVSERLSRIVDRVPDYLVRSLLGAVVFLYFVGYNLFSPTILGIKIPNIVSIGSMLVLSTLPFLGLKALRMTALDIVLYLWVLLATISHLYASIVLQRLMFEQYLLLYLSFLFTCWMMYRIAFAAVALRPRLAMRTFQQAFIACVLLAAVVAILQGFGFTKGPVDIFVQTINGGALVQVLEGNETGRPTAWFGGPNVLGFYSACGVAMVAGWMVGRHRDAGGVTSWLAVIAIGVFTYSCISSQSRQALLIISVMVLIVLVHMCLKKKIIQALSISAASIGFGLFAVFTGGKRFYYLTSIFTSGVKTDTSFVVRKYFYSYFFRVANDAAPLGTGVSQVNNPLLLGLAGYDFFYVPGIDNEWVNIFQAHGVLGPFLLIALYSVMYKSASREATHSNLERRVFGLQCLFLLLVFLLFSTGGVRVAKVETAGAFFLPLGVLIALRRVGKEDYEDIRFSKRQGQPLVEVIA